MWNFFKFCFDWKFLGPGRIRIRASKSCSQFHIIYSWSATLLFCISLEILGTLEYYYIYVTGAVQVCSVCQTEEPTDKGFKEVAQELRVDYIFQEYQRLDKLILKPEIISMWVKNIYIVLQLVLRSQSEPRFSGRSRFKIWAGARYDFLGRLRLLYLASEKKNDLKMFIFHCIPVLYIVLHNK